MPETILQGVIKDCQTGAPIPGAEIRIFFDQGKRARRLIGESDSSGAFEFQIKLGKGREIKFKPVIRAHRYREFTVNFGEERPTLQAGEHRVMGFELSPGPTVRGRVIDEDGQPISSAEVKTTLVGPNWCSWPHTFGYGDYFEPPPIRTDSRGEFIVPYLHADDAESRETRYVLTFTHPKYIMTHVQQIERLPQKDRWINLGVVMKRGVRAGGVVRFANGRPVAGAEVKFMAADPRPDEPHCVPVEKSAKTNRQARFRIYGIEPRAYNITVSGDSCAPHRVERYVLPIDGDDSIEFQVQPAATFRGRLVDSAGKPMRYQEFHVITQSPMTHRTFKSGRDGRFEVGGLMPDAELKFLVPFRFQGTFQPGSRPVEIRISNPQSIHGRAVDAETGAPINSAFRVSYDGPGYSSGADFKSPTGEFRFESILPSEYDLIVHSEDFVTETASVKVTETGLAKPLTFRLSRGAALMGKVMNAGNGKPLAGAKVSVDSTARGYLCFYDKKETTTDSDGNFRIRGLGARDYALEVSYPNRAKRILWGIAIKPGQKTKRLKIEMLRGGKIRGRARDASGKPAASVLAKLAEPGRKTSPYSLPQSLTDLDGRFELTHVPPGKVMLHVGSYSQEVEVVDRRTTSFKDIVLDREV